MRRSGGWRIGLLCGALLAGCSGGDLPEGRIAGGSRRPAAVDAGPPAGAAPQAAGAGRAARQILFGDLHVHTSYSLDAFAMSLPLAGGEGSHPSADACDFARYCSALDFFAYTDHAESLTPAHWQAQKETARQCNDLAGAADDPDLVAFMGFEWTQVGRTPETHFGHKCVVFAGSSEEALPARPINAQPDEGREDLFTGLDRVPIMGWLDPLNWRQYEDFGWLVKEISGIPRCPQGVDTRTLPPDCAENAATPDVLFEKLAQWGLPVQVIPHGQTWGNYTPPGTRLEKQLTGKYHDPGMQRLLEISSGHGNSEEYREWREFTLDAEGRKQCPEPTPEYLPCCWQAGEIMRARCDGLSPAACEARVAEARERHLAAGLPGHLVFPDAGAEEWLDCGQCRDCFKPTFSLRPMESAQYALALSNPEEPEAGGRPLRFRYGFVASSDNHKARPGTGYKQYDRPQMSEATGARSAFTDAVLRAVLKRAAGVASADPRRPLSVPEGLQGILGVDTERVSSFLYPGGLVAVHAEGRSREAIWDALQRREVYGTSGPRILLHFDLLNGPEGPVPMGGEVVLGGTPRFEVRALGAAHQQPGCPEESVRGLPAERLARLCRGECFHPAETRHVIAAIEIVRIRPQRSRDEAVGPLIEDPWRRFECPADPAGCVVRFADEEFRSAGRDAVYYVRALQEATPAINGANLRTRFDAEGKAVSTEPCFGDYRTRADDDCLAPVHERAWSSPIFVDAAAELVRREPQPRLSPRSSERP